MTLVSCAPQHDSRVAVQSSPAPPNAPALKHSPAVVDLVGEWRYSDPVQSCQYVFARDGSFRGTVTLRGRKVSEFAGRWTLRDNHLMYEYTSDALGSIPAGSKDQDKLLSVAADHFEIEAADGSRRRYQRVK